MGMKVMIPHHRTACTVCYSFRPLSLYNHVTSDIHKMGVLG